MPADWRGPALELLHSWCAANGYTVRDLVGDARDRRTTDARHDAMLLIYEQRNLSLVRTGELFGGRHHTTVINGVERARQRRAAGASTVPPAPSTKLCPDCGTPRPFEAFNRNAAKADGLQNYCRDHQNERERASRARTTEALPRRAHRPYGSATGRVGALIRAELAATLETTAFTFGTTKTEIVERALERELRRMWTVCRSCQQRARVEGSDRCGVCIADTMRAAS